MGQVSNTLNEVVALLVLPIPIFFKSHYYISDPYYKYYLMTYCMAKEVPLHPTPESPTILSSLAIIDSQINIATI